MRKAYFFKHQYLPLWMVLSLLGIIEMEQPIYAVKDLAAAIRRAQYLLNGTYPSDGEILAATSTDGAYKAAIDRFLAHPNFYDVMVRYHQLNYGVGLKDEYLDELVRDDIDSLTRKVPQVTCESVNDLNPRYRCGWSSDNGRTGTGGCAATEELPAKVFWYPGVTAWVCPSVYQTCGSDLSRCFINYWDKNAVKSSELGATEIFDSSVAITKSLSRQPAGIAAAVVTAGYPYTKVLEPGLTAIDGALAHLFKQGQLFDLNKLNAPQELVQIVNGMKLNNTRFQLVYTGSAYEQAGVLSTFGWLRRFDKNRSRAHYLYERFMCRKFTSQLPRVFPQDPGNLRTTPPCNGCHSILDPLADFFKVWGEGAGIYGGQGAAVDASFAGHSGRTMSDLALIIQNDNAFATCTVEHVFSWLMGREFYHDEATLRAALTNYFVTTKYNFKELVYALATHPAFLEATRQDALVGDPLDQPPLGQPPGGETARPCGTITWTTDIQPRISQCTSCHGTGNGVRVELATKENWNTWRNMAVNLMSSGTMPPGQSGPPLSGSVYDLKEAVRCWDGAN
jgi:hypothetical protein